MSTFKLTVAQQNKNWKSFLEEIRLVLPSEELFRMVVSLRDNTIFENRVYAGFFDAPAGVGQHHAYPGGLVEHLLEMWNVYKHMKTLLPQSEAEVNDANVMSAIIIHDLHKAYKTYFFLKDEEKTGRNADRIFGYADVAETKLLTQDQHTAMLLSEYGVKLPLIVWNSLYCSEGGYKKNPPKEVSALAKLVYLLDEFSSNVIFRMDNPRPGIDFTK